MSDQTDRPNPLPPGNATPPEPELLALWQVLEKEMQSLHGDALQLDDSYVRDRDAAIAKAKADLKESLQKRADHAGFTDAQLDDEVKKQIAFKPQLINAPACRELFKRVHRFVEADPQNAAKHSALCLSGGGIRSATFALGVLQGLARQGVLQSFAYLSTVSGGGYVGGWLSSWIHRSEPKVESPVTDEQRYEQKLAAVARALGEPEKPSAPSPDKPPADPPTSEPKKPFETEPAPVRHLRAFSNYLTPALGLLSGDGWAVAATVARNLLLNWLLIIPALLLALLIPRIALYFELLPLGEEQQAGIVAAVLGFIAGVYALSNLLARRGRSQVDVLWHSVAPIVLFSAFSTLAWYWARSAHPESGFFADRLQRIAFYVGWGALTAALAIPIGACIRKRYSPPPARTEKKIPLISTIVRCVCLVTVFGLTGLAAWWFSDKASGWMVSAAELEKVPLVAGSKPAEAKPAIQAGPVWALISREQDKCTLTSWVSVDGEKLRVHNCVAEFFTGPPAVTAQEFRLKAAIVSVCCGFPLLLALIFAANTVLTGLLSRRMEDEDREWLARASGWAFLLALVCGGINLLVLHGPVWLVALWSTWPKLLSSVAGGSGLLTILGGRSDKMAASDKADEKPDSKKTDVIFSLLVKFAAPIFVIVMLMFFSLVTTLLLQKIGGDEANPKAHWQLLWDTRWSWLGIAIAIIGTIAFFSTRTVNINKFSLHAMYRNRLIRAYLGATNWDRSPNLFTGFDENDNVSMQALRGQRPLHVLNTALNLVSGNDLAWQQRMAMSFSVTPFACGSATLGYRDSAWYGRGIAPKSTGITLGTALSISGAAVSPNHGYNSSPLIAFLLTFFNARLGGWFGNPGIAGAKTWTMAAPKRALQPIIAEAFGMTDSEHPYVYLSDGGHFENLGLYEMVLRRCRIIVVSDAGCDPDYWFEDLGNAVAKIRVDFGIPIEFDPDIDIRKYTPQEARTGTLGGRHCAIARIRYSEVDGKSLTGADRDGWLIYVKPAMCGKEPMDVFHYAKEHPVFPHEPTTDQWFSESQFESYRVLGKHSIDEICSGVNLGDGLIGFRDQACAHVGGTTVKPATATPEPPSDQEVVPEPASQQKQPPPAAKPKPSTGKSSKRKK